MKNVYHKNNNGKDQLGLALSFMFAFSVLIRYSFFFTDGGSKLNVGGRQKKNCQEKFAHLII